MTERPLSPRLRAERVRLDGVESRVERRFPGLIAEVEGRLRALVEAVDVNDLSRHNAGYRRYGVDAFRHLVVQERARFLHHLEVIAETPGARTVCDLGTFIPYLPLALALSGYQVRIVEKFEYYGASFIRVLSRLAADTGMELHDLDILRDPFDAIPPADVALLTAVVEHLNGSPRELLRKIRPLLAPGGQLLFEVPNIVEFTKRLHVLLGGSPLMDYRDYIDSAYPYMGHNREMTVPEVAFLLEASGYHVDRLECYDYAPGGERSLKGHLAQALKAMLPVPNKGEAIFATARPGA